MTGKGRCPALAEQRDRKCVETQIPWTPKCPSASPCSCWFQRGMSWWCPRRQTTAGSRWFGTSTTSGATPSVCPRRRGCSRGGRYSTCTWLLSMHAGPDRHWLMARVVLHVWLSLLYPVNAQCLICVNASLGKDMHWMHNSVRLIMWNSCNLECMPPHTVCRCLGVHIHCVYM